MSKIQFTRIAIPGGDVAHKNYSTTVTLAAGTVVKADTSNLPGPGGTPGGIVACTDDTGAIGILLENLPPGATGRVALNGSAVTTAQGAITYGADVMGSTSVSGAATARTTGKRVLGWARNTAADGDPVEVWIAPANNA